VVRHIGVGWTINGPHFVVILGAYVKVLHEEGDGSSKGFPLLDAAEDAYPVRLPALGGQAARTGSSAVQLLLN